MEESDSHAGLKSRLKVLATHIAELRQMMNQAKDARRNEDFDEIEKLERHYKALDDKLRQLRSRRTGPSARRGIRNGSRNQRTDAVGRGALDVDRIRLSVRSASEGPEIVAGSPVGLVLCAELLSCGPPFSSSRPIEGSVRLPLGP